MNDKEIRMKDMVKELEKCLESPYYFATTYLRVKNKGEWEPYTTIFNEQEFNETFNEVKQKLKEGKVI